MRWRCPTLALLLQLLLGCGLRRAAALALPGDASQAVVLTMTSALAHWHYVCLWHTRQAHPNSPMYLGAFFYRDSEYTWRPTPHELAFLAALDVTVVRIEEDTTPELARLHATFRHASGNGLVYERFCTARFLGVQHVMDAHGLSSALTFDMDIAMFRNAFQAFAPVAAVEHMWTFGSWIAMYSRELIGSLNEFILDFFAGDAASVARNFVKHGFTVKQTENPEYFERLRNLTAHWWPEDMPEAAGVTDMEIAVAWLNANNRTQMHCHRHPQPACFQRHVMLPRVYNVPALNVELMRDGNPSGCRTEGGATSAQRESDFRAVFDVDAATGQPSLDGAPVVSIHFNGYCKPYVCLRAFCEPLLRWAGGNASLLGAVRFCCDPPT